MRELNKARRVLAQNGTNITNADLQAIWWYPEKNLCAKMGGRVSEAMASSVIFTEPCDIISRYSKLATPSDTILGREPQYQYGAPTSRRTTTHLFGVDQALCCVAIEIVVAL
jgi:hypothetical protein